MDLQFVQYLDLLPFTQVIPLQGSPVPTLDIYGRDFSKVAQVFINNIKSPDVVVLTRTRLLAQIPEALWGNQIVDIGVFSNGLVMTERSKLVFTLRGRKKVRGLTKLIQVFTKLLLQSPVTDSFQDIGGGVVALVGKTIHRTQRGSFESLLHSAVTSVSSSLRKSQQKDSRIPLDEKLLSADVIGLGYSPEAGQASMEIALRNEAGEAGIAGLSTEASQ